MAKRPLTNEEKLLVYQVLVVNVLEPKALLRDGRSATYDKRNARWVIEDKEDSTDG